MTITAKGDTYQYEDTTALKKDAIGVVAMNGGAAIGNTNPMAVVSASGIAASASFTPVAEAYSAGDTISTAQQFAFTFANGLVVPSGSSIRILTSSIKIEATAVISGETSYTLHLYTVTPPSAQANNAAWTLASADLPSYAGSIALGTPVDLGAALYVKTGGINLDIVLAGTSLFGSLVTVGAFTATAVARQIRLIGVAL